MVNLKVHFFTSLILNSSHLKKAILIGRFLVKCDEGFG
jgi:hypothetical protein